MCQLLTRGTTCLEPFDEESGISLGYAHQEDRPSRRVVLPRRGLRLMAVEAVPRGRSAPNCKTPAWVFLLFGQKSGSRKPIHVTPCRWSRRTLHCPCKTSRVRLDISSASNAMSVSFIHPSPAYLNYPVPSLARKISPIAQRRENLSADSLRWSEISGP